MSHADSAEFQLESDAGQTPEQPLTAVGVGSGALLAVSFGGGTNSTAMLCGLRERGIRPDLVLFADTGSEMPHTYEHVAMMQAQVLSWWGIELRVCRKLRAGEFEGLERECLRGAKLPALAYGSRACSVKYKHEPQNRYMRAVMKERGVKVAMRAIGFDAGEAHRVKPSPDAYAVNWYPLVEWGWRREECVAAIARHGLPQPGKSACFFCPAMKRGEVLRLRDEQPELLARALEIERRAQTGANRQLRGLGGERNLWANWLAMDASQVKLWLDIEPAHAPCGCYDGG
jgi:hypothetical protein